MDVNPLLMDRTRLAIITTLAREDAPVAFGTLRESLNLSGGNLSVHARKLEEAGLIAIDKKFLDRKPVTSFTCTDNGRKEIERYLGEIERLLSEGMNRKNERHAE